MTTLVPIYVRRVALASMLAGTAAFTGTAVGEPATACAEPREWDIGAYDSCYSGRSELNVLGIISDQQLADEHRFCCERSGGVWGAGANGGATCVAPPAEAERAPAAPPVLPPESQATLWLPPPPPPPEAMAPGSASRS